MTKDEALEIIVKAKNERNNISKLISRIKMEFLQKPKKIKSEKFISNGEYDRIIEKVASVICDYYQVTLDELKIKCREHEIVNPRQLIIYICFKDFRVTKKYLGKYFNQDHATAIHSIKKIQNIIDTESIAREKFTELRMKIKDELPSQNN